MEDREAKWRLAVEHTFDEGTEMSGIENPSGTGNRTPDHLIRELEKARKMEVKQWWEITSLRKYLECKRVHRGLRIMLLATYKDMNENVVNAWCQNTEECSIKLMRTLNKYEKHKMELWVAKIEMVMKQFERFKDDEDVKDQVIKIEKSLQKDDEEIIEWKAKKFMRDRLDF
ncbi:hypothetical protein NDU88_007513 [Pleurodeles waltl]|uniref:Uncharacterized protein n=1 Tax=Pleurodeles waltl TaxID=8319 RepID=A0AAV7VU21_PLEWA|nr:hypothetical protein NDU88_007513 [Pleurodeles waltl]